MCVCVCVCMLSVAQSCLTLYDPLDCSPPNSSVHGIFQAILVLLLRNLIEWPSHSMIGAGAPIMRRQIDLEKHVCQNTSRQGWGRGRCSECTYKESTDKLLELGIETSTGHALARLGDG